MNELAQKLLNRIEAGRLQDRLFAMISIPSLTGQAQAVAEHCAVLLEGIGLPAEIRPLAGHPTSPSVVARRRGSGDAPSLQYAAHLDTIHTPHAPPHLVGGRIFGRGSVDMKSGMVAMLEATQILIEGGVALPGDLLITGYDMHEHPVGHAEGVYDLIDAGIFGGAVLVTEGPADEIAIAGKGTTSFEIEIRSPAGSPHELSTTPEVANPCIAAIELGRRLIAFGKELRQREVELLGTETIFLSSIHGGDFFNRLPGSTTIGGTRRFAPGRGFPAIQQELQAIADEVVAGMELTAAVTLGPMREGFRQAADTRLIQSVQAAHRELYSEEIRLAGQLFGADNEFFINRAGVPAVCVGVGLGRSHADVEYCDVEDLVKLARKLLLTTLIYFDLA